MRRIVASVCLPLLLAALAACAAPATTPVATAPAAANPPAEAVPAPAAESGQPPVLDFSCGSDADCEVKDVGNCCGYFPACVNKDSPTDPAAVQAQCRASGRMSVCGFRQISQCSCRAGKCEAVGEPPGGWNNGGPALPLKPEESTD